MVAQDRGTDEDVASRIRKTPKTLSQLWPVWPIKQRYKLCIFKKKCQVGTAVQVTKQVSKRLQTFVNRCLRNILPHSIITRQSGVELPRPAKTWTAEINVEEDSNCAAQDRPGLESRS
ncbi:unnamed protein product [Nezara viridula]|uniref:Uncharacterized protein n=1 Tax=Nezara viridula TaxID=85310 RepID=A0A9P0MTX1_NEZVI|nr:unnamed protein product [Nezara viridula]